MLEHQLYARAALGVTKLGRKLGKQGFEMFPSFSILWMCSWVDCQSKQSAECFGQ